MDNNIIVMISGEGTTLQAILDKCKNTKVIGVIVDQPFVPGITRSLEAKIPHILMFAKHPKETKSQHMDRMIRGIDTIIQKQGNIQYIILAGFMTLLTADFIQYFEKQGIRIINIHPSLLPKYKGLHTYQRVLEAEDESHGMTIHYVTEEMDSGEIIFQASYYITDLDNVLTLEKKTKELEQRWYPKVIDSLFTGEPIVNF